MNWTIILAEESRRNSILRLEDLVRRYNVQEVVARNALRRYEIRGLVEHISNKIYVNRLNQNSVLTCVTTEYPKTFRSSSLTISYRKISEDLYWGFEEKRTRYNNYQIALPEKALLDWIYLTRQEGLPTPLDEINLQFLDRQRLREFASRFPRTVEEVVNQLLLGQAVAA